MLVCLDGIEPNRALVWLSETCRLAALYRIRTDVRPENRPRGIGSSVIGMLADDVYAGIHLAEYRPDGFRFQRPVVSTGSLKPDNNALPFREVLKFGKK